MRIIGGKLKGKKILSTSDKNTRPLKDLVRESIFNILKHSKNDHVNLEGAVILDLFSGTGSFGIECLSRGSKKVIFVENYNNTINILKKNLENLKLNKFTKIIEEDSYFLSKSQLNFRKFDLIYLDPPFQDTKINQIIKNIKKMEITSQSTVVVMHRSKKIIEKISNDFLVTREEKYGLSKILFGKIF